MTFENPILAFKPEDLSAICRVADRRDYRAGETIFYMGDDDRGMFYISRGEVELVFPEGGLPKTVSQGNFFGELAFMLPHFPRTGTAIAKTDCHLYYLHQSIYDILIEENPHLLCTLLRNTCTYLLESEQNLIDSLNLKNRDLEKALDYLRKTRAELDLQEIAARTDELTGLYNRRGLNAVMEALVVHGRSGAHELGLIMLDLDHFKKVNDTYGHHRGDEVLQKVADIIRREIRHSDTASRRGGDEFVILMPGITMERGWEVAENIRRRIEQEFPVDAMGIKVTGSVGLALITRDDSLGDLLLRADRNLYRAKEHGRNQVIFSRD